MRRKKPYDKKHDEDKVRYAKEKEEAGDAPEEDGASDTKRKRQKRQPGQPKKGKSAFVFFGEHKRKEMKEQGQSATFSEMGKIIGDAWKELSDDEKKPFQDKAVVDKERAAKLIEEWEAEHGPIEKKPRKKKAGKATKKKKKGDDDADEDTGGGDDDE